MIHSQVIIHLILLAVFFLPKWITNLVKLVQNARLEHPNKPFDLLFCLKVDHNVRVRAGQFWVTIIFFLATSIFIIYK